MVLMLESAVGCLGVPHLPTHAFLTHSAMPALTAPPAPAAHPLPARHMQALLRCRGLDLADERQCLLVSIEDCAVEELPPGGCRAAPRRASAARHGRHARAGEGAVPASKRPACKQVGLERGASARCYVHCAACAMPRVSWYSTLLLHAASVCPHGCCCRCWLLAGHKEIPKEWAKRKLINILPGSCIKMRWE